MPDLIYRRALAATLTAGALIAATAHPVQAASVWAPTPQLLFNTPAGPGGTKAEQDKLRVYLENTLAVMAPRSVARIAVLRLNIDSTADAIIRAHRRGVVVRVVFSAEGRTPQEDRVLKALGQDTAARSWAVACWGSCNSAAKSVMHLKLYAFSSTGPAGKRTSANTVVMGSSNLTTTNHYLNWNESQAVQDSAIYTAVSRFIDQAAKMTDRPAYATAASKDGRYRLYLWPAGSSAADPYLSALKSISAADCRNPGKGYGAGGRTQVRVAMFTWSAGRTDVARELVRLRKAGCDVGVLWTQNNAVGTMAQQVISTLFDGKVPTYNSRIDGSGDGRPDWYLHSKFMVVNGRLFGKPNKVVWNGSANFTRNALTVGNEDSLRTDHDATADAFLTRWVTIARFAKRDTVRPDVTPPPLSKSRQAPDARGREVEVDPDMQDLQKL